MTRSAATALALLAALSVAPAAPAQERPTSAPLVRMRDGHGSDLLFQVHPRTLRPLSRPIRTFRTAADMALSADGRLLAHTFGAEARSLIHLVDVARWRSLGIARMGRQGPLNVGWIGPNRVMAIAGQGFGRQRSGDTMFAYGTRWFADGRPSESTGLLAFDGTGNRLFTRFRGQQIATLGTRGQLLYTWVRRTRTLHVMDVRDGRTLNEVQTSRRIPFLLTPRP